MLKAFWNFLHFEKKFITFNAKNLGTISQRAAKLLAVKFGVLPGSNHSQSSMASNFAALWLTDPKFSALKDLNLFQTVSKVQETSSVLRVSFAWSKWPHFKSAYLLRGPFVLLSIVSKHFCVLFLHNYTKFYFQAAEVFLLMFFGHHSIIMSQLYKYRSHPQQIVLSNVEFEVFWGFLLSWFVEKFIKTQASKNL